MARYRGNFTVAANYEPLKAAPFDSRELVQFKSDLTNAETWRQPDGGIWTYIGMVVSVSADADINKRGRYLLVDKDWSIEANWLKIADDREIKSLADQIELIKNSGGSTVDLTAYAKTEDIAKTYATIQSVEAIYTIAEDGAKGILAEEIARATKADKDNAEAIAALEVKFNGHSGILTGIGGEGEPATVLDAIKNYTLPSATTETLGGVKLSAEIGVNAEQQLEVNTLSTDKLVQGEQELVLYGGSST